MQVYFPPDLSLTPAPLASSLPPHPLTHPLHNHMAVFEQATQPAGKLTEALVEKSQQLPQYHIQIGDNLVKYARGCSDCRQQSLMYNGWV